MVKRLLFTVAVIFMFVAAMQSFAVPKCAAANSAIEIEIASVEDFMAISDGTTASYKLVDDLDFAEYSHVYKPINFCGTLNGNGHSLNNLNLQSNVAAGLFECVDGANIYDLTINNFQVYSKTKAGALAVTIKNSTLKNVSINLSTCYIRGFECAGKLATSVENCTFIDVVVKGGIVNGIETDELAPYITNTTQETTKTEVENPPVEEEPLPENPDDENGESETPTKPSDNNNKPEDNENSGENNTGDNNEGGSNGTPDTTTPSENVTPNVPPESETPPAVPDISGIASVGSANGEIVVNNVNATKIIVICVLVVAVVVYGFVETPLKTFVAKHFGKNK